MERTARNMTITTLAALVLTALALLVLAGQARASFPGSNGLIVFTSDRTVGVNNPTGDREIFTIRPDGTSLRQLTFNNATDSEPVFSGDGKRIAFSSTRDGNSEIYKMDADGMQQRRLTLSAAFDSEPAFSPDGARIAFRRAGFGGDGEIFTMGSADGTGQKRLTDDGVDESDPAFSPDGTKIVLEKRPQGLVGDYEIFTIDSSDGSDARQFTFNGTADLDPTFSPDGTKIAFTNHGSIFADSEIFETSAADASGTRPLTNNSFLDSRPAYSPDGTRIAFQSRRGAFGDEIVTANALNGGSPTDLTNVAGHDFSPDWQPNTAPRISDLTPHSTTDRTPTIGAKVTDVQTDLRGGDIALSLDGTAGFAFFYDRDIDRLRFTPGSNLSLGEHTVRITATDEAGLGASRQLTFRVVRP